MKRGAAPGPLGLSLVSGSIGAGGVGLVATAVSALVGGSRGTVSALAGVLVVLLFFVASLWVVEVANRVDPTLTLPVGLTVYSILLVWLGLLAYGTSLPDRLHRGAFAWTVIAVTLGWVIAQAVAVWRRRIPYVSVELPSRDPSDEPFASERPGAGSGAVPGPGPVTMRDDSGAPASTEGTERAT